MRSARRALVLLTTAAALSIGASAAPARAAGSKPNACTVLRRSVIESVLGEDVARSKREQATPRRASVCNWDVGAPESGEVVSVWLQRGKAAKKGYRTAVDLFGDAGEDLPFLGRRAFYAADVGTVYVLRGSTLLYVQRLDPSGETAPEELREQTISLVEHALERIEP